jgi:hypothetical protein
MSRLWYVCDVFSAPPSGKLTSNSAQIGYALLYTLPRTDANIGPLLFGFYLTAFAFGASPLLVAWIGANTAGSTKKAGLVSIYQACSAAGNIIAPNLFRATDAPLYRNGLKYVL